VKEATDVLSTYCIAAVARVVLFAFEHNRTGHSTIQKSPSGQIDRGVETTGTHLSQKRKNIRLKRKNKGQKVPPKHESE
jgi:hypothetical protein